MGHFTVQIKNNLLKNDTETLTLERLSDIPFIEWKDKVGQITLQFHSYGYEVNFLFDKVLSSHSFDGVEVEASASGIEALLLDAPRRTFNSCMSMGMPEEIIDALVCSVEKRNISIVQEFGAAKESDSIGWEGPLAMLAGAGLFAMAKSAITSKSTIKKEKEAEVEHLENLVKK